MFQTFTSASNKSVIPDRIARLRALLMRNKLDALLIPRADEHQGEYVAPCAERLKWLTGFSGSAGLAAITTRHAGLFVDGRYTIQAAQECDPTLFDFPGLARTKLADWLGLHVAKGGVVGFDPWLHTAGDVKRLTEQLAPLGLKLRATNRNLVDLAWGRERPAPPLGPIVIHPLKRAGRGAADKIADVQRRLIQDKHDAAILTLPDSIAWLFNIRGSDVPHNPVALAFAIVPAIGRPELFIDQRKLSTEVECELGAVVDLRDPSALLKRTAELKSAKKRVRLDPATAAYAFARSLGSTSYMAAPDPCLALKAIKNTTEIAGARRAHIRDGIAMTRFLAWLDDRRHIGRLDEISAVRKLEELRLASRKLKDIAFDTIAGSGPNGAIVHYRVSEATNRIVRKGELFLIDSGAQYEDGTTDITRTVAMGPPTPEMRERFTLVLRGHIAVAQARFPHGTRGMDIDPFARRALWEHGLDYDHGTGHGVGSYLSVHEGPQSISRLGHVPLEPGMICSNEPGYYKSGYYGIRIENLVLVTKSTAGPSDEREMLEFETLTLAPIDRQLIKRDMLTREERDWLNAYHRRVNDVIGTELDEPTRAWLAAATKPI